MTGSELLAVAVLLAAYVASLYLHPYRRCHACNGAGFHNAGVFRYASRGCHACGGRGIHQRVGASVLGVGGSSQRSTRIQKRGG